MAPSNNEWECKCRCHDPGETKVVHSKECCSVCHRCGKRVSMNTAHRRAHLKECPVTQIIPSEEVLQRITFSKRNDEDDEGSALIPDYVASGVIEVPPVPGDVFYRPKK